jgi:hypothetical protein
MYIYIYIYIFIPHCFLFPPMVFTGTASAAVLAAKTPGNSGMFHYAPFPACTLLTHIPIAEQL